MAKKVANGMNKRQSRARNLSTRSSDTSSESNFKTISGRSKEDLSILFRDLLSNPAVKYVAGGIASAVLTRLASNMSEKYPELSRFLRENIEGFEGRLGQFRSGFDDKESRI